MDNYICPNGHGQFVLGKRVLGKIGGAVGGGAIGSATKDPIGTIVGAFIGIAVGHFIDELVLPSCPECGIALQVVDEAFI